MYIYNKSGMYFQNVLLSSRCGFVVEGLRTTFKALSLSPSTTVLLESLKNIIKPYESPSHVQVVLIFLLCNYCLKIY